VEAPWADCPGYRISHRWRWAVLVEAPWADCPGYRISRRWRWAVLVELSPTDSSFEVPDVQFLRLTPDRGRLARRES
jgi:hypothetical protein